MKIAEADLVSTEANLREAYASFAELKADCEGFCAKVNGASTAKTVPAEALVEERDRLHVLPAAPHTMALGQTSSVTQPRNRHPAQH